jgi:hypothetical protein
LWRRQFEAGNLKFRGLLVLKLPPGERVAVRVGRVHLIEGQDGDASDVGGAVVPTVQGAARATNDRLLLTGNGRRIVKEWRWADVAAVGLLRWGIGVRLELTAGGTDVLGSVWHSTVPGSRPDPRQLLVGWLEVEAAYVASSGADVMDRWFSELPGRLGGAISDPPPGMSP